MNFGACASKTSRDVASAAASPADDEAVEKDDGISKATGEKQDLAGDAERDLKLDNSVIEAPPAAPSANAPAAAAVTPALAAITVSFDQISQEMGIPQSRLKDQVQTLSQFMTRRKLPKNLCAEEKESTEKLCNLVDAYREDKLDFASDRTKSPKIKLRSYLIPVLQQGDYARARQALRSVPSEQTLSYVPEILKTKGCPRNLSVAALRDVEAELPKPEARKAMESLYQHASECLTPADEGYEVTHLRQALLRHLWGDKDKSKESINKALNAQESRERPRVLYWAGVILGSEKDGKQYWDRLVKNNPLSFYALEVWKKGTVDPYQIISERPQLQLNREVIGNDDLFQAMRWVEALYLKNQTAAAEVLTLWIGEHFKDTLMPSQAMYLSALKFQKGSTLNMIRFLTSRIGEDSTMLNQQTLSMLFPRPYFDIFDKAATRTDVFLVLSVARQESGFNPLARSPANARGLLQLLPSTARMLAGRRNSNLYSPQVNVPLGAKFVSQLIAKFGSVELALAAYNAGPGRIPGWVERYPSDDPVLFIDLIPFRETRDYVANILRNNYWYHRLYGDETKAVSLGMEYKDRQHSEIVSSLVEAHRTFRHTQDSAVSSAR